MKRFFMLLICAAMLMTSCAGFREPQKVVIGIDDGYAPIAFKNERNELVGFDIDLAKEAMRRLNFDVEFRPIAWETKEDELSSGHIDMIWNGLNITPERRKIMLFSKSYMIDRQIVFVKRGDDSELVVKEDLADKVVGTQAGSIGEYYIDKDKALKKSFRELKIYHSYLNALNALDDGEIDALICDEIVGRYAGSNEGDKFKALEITIGSVTEIGIGFRKDNVELRDQVQDVFDEMIKDGTAKQISEQWFNADLIKSRL